MLNVKRFLTITSVFCMGMALASTFDFSGDKRIQRDLARDIHSKGAEVIALAELRPGMKVLDVFGGGGYHAEIISKVVGDSGQVYLHNNSAYMPLVGIELDSRLANNRLSNVIRYDKEAEQLALAANSFDAIFFILGYHDLYHKSDQWSVDKSHFLNQLHRALKPSGKLIIVDHSAPVGSGISLAQTTHRIEGAYVKKELAEFGFTFVSSSDLLANPEDDLLGSPFSASIKRKTDRFVYVFTK